MCCIVLVSSSYHVDEWIFSCSSVAVALSMPSNIPDPEVACVPMRVGVSHATWYLVVSRGISWSVPGRTVWRDGLGEQEGERQRIHAPTMFRDFVTKIPALHYLRSPGRHKVCMQT